MRKYITFCHSCDGETRNTKKSSKPIDFCRKCITAIDRDRIKKEKESRKKQYEELIRTSQLNGKKEGK